MIFSTQCPSCEATFPIDSAKVPDGGVYARCSQCEGVFLVEVPPQPTAAEPPAPAPPVEEPSVEPAVEAAAPAEVEVEAPVVESTPPAAPEVPSVDVEASAPAAPSAPPTFGKRDPNERAQRLARVLVSDMIAYHPDRHRRSLEEGTLKADFDEEVEKSWNEYVDQVGADLANSTSYFTDALNEILAKGQNVF